MKLILGTANVSSLYSLNQNKKLSKINFIKILNNKKMQDLITVYSEATPNPESMKFVIRKMVLPNDSVDFRDVSKV